MNLDATVVEKGEALPPLLSLRGRLRRRAEHKTQFLTPGDFRPLAYIRLFINMQAGALDLAS